MYTITITKKYHGPQVFRRFGGPLSELFRKPLDYHGSVVKEWLFRKGRIKNGTEFFGNYSDEELEILIREMQNLAHKVTYKDTLVADEQLILQAFRRSIRKLSRMNSDLL